MAVITLIVKSLLPMRLFDFSLDWQDIGKQDDEQGEGHALHLVDQAIDK